MIEGLPVLDNAKQVETPQKYNAIDVHMPLSSEGLASGTEQDEWEHHAIEGRKERGEEMKA